MKEMKALSLFAAVFSLALAAGVMLAGCSQGQGSGAAAGSSASASASESASSAASDASASATVTSAAASEAAGSEAGVASAPASEASSAAVGMANPWSDNASAAEAAANAGIDAFELPADLNLGGAQPYEITYRSMAGIAEANIDFAAAQVTLRKGLPAAAVDEVGISGDYNAYAHEWTQKVGDIEVACAGNREGEAQNAQWTTGDYAYSIVAQGLGGDTDWGVDENLLATLVSGTK